MGGISIWIWLAATIFFIVLEAVTVQIVSVWFILGSVVAFVSAILGLSPVGQVMLFVGVSAASLIFLRPLLKRKAMPQDVPTNADRVINMVAVVVEEVDNQMGTGRVMVDGGTWAARSFNGEVIELDEKTIVHSIQGVTLIVYKIQGG